MSGEGGDAVMNEKMEAAKKQYFSKDFRWIMRALHLIASLRNLGYEFGDRDVEEAMSRGGKLVLSDFTEEGMAMMADIHGRSGEKHEASSVRRSDVGDYLEDSRFHRP
jgi:hypothetical protein